MKKLWIIWMILTTSILCFLSWALAECKSFDFWNKNNKNNNQLINLVIFSHENRVGVKSIEHWIFTQSVVYFRWKFGSPILCTNAPNFELLSNFSKNSMNTSSWGNRARTSSIKPFKPPIVVFVPFYQRAK